MCQATLILNSIVRLSTRLYRHRLVAVARNQYKVSQLARLNCDLNNFYELLYSQWNTVTKDYYAVFGPQLQIMLNTLRELYNTCKKLSDIPNFDKETEKLGMNYSAIFEINSDIKNFRIKEQHDDDWARLLKQASDVVKSIKA